MIDEDVRRYLTKECKVLAKDCVDMTDAREYLDELVSDTLSIFPFTPPTEIRGIAELILSDLFES